MISFIYQRYSLGNFSGPKLAREMNIPLVLEYNGSEVWVSKNWGKPLNYEEIFTKIEELNLSTAHLIVVVSQVIKDELIDRGIPQEKILVNPNGVDPEKYSPSIEGTTIRQKYGFENKTVIGFIGTFGMWHGAEILAKAFGILIHQNPQYREYVRLLMIGDGVTMPQVIETLSEYNVKDIAVLTGTVPQQEGPKYLAACDFFVSPHVPNADGTRFFGSPTKLFEYMSMGKGIVASHLEQIGEVLEHEKTAWMVKPGDVDSLVEGLKVLVGNPDLSKKLGKAARNEVLKNYTWEKHTERIVRRLKELCPCR